MTYQKAKQRNSEKWYRHLEQLELNREAYYKDQFIRDRLNLETEQLLSLEGII